MVRAMAMVSQPTMSASFFFNDTATTEIYTLSLHDALPIFHLRPDGQVLTWFERYDEAREVLTRTRSEEHTSELQSQSNLVCRLLLEKKTPCRRAILRDLPCIYHVSNETA